MGRIVIQRVVRGAVFVDGKRISSIGAGVVVLVGLAQRDTEADLRFLARKLLALRLWDGAPAAAAGAEEGAGEGARWKRDVREIDGELLLVSQFTLLARTNRGTKPVFVDSLSPDAARPMFERFVEICRAGHRADRIQTGQFQTKSEVEIVNDGPVSIIIDSPSTGEKEAAEEKD